MKKLHSIVAAAVATLALAGTAHADTIWNFSFSDIASGSTMTASGQFVTTGNGSTPSDILSITGTYSDGTTVNGALSLVPVSVGGGVQNTSPDGFYYFDNVYGGAGGLDNAGLLFLAGGQEVNLYTDNGTFTVATTYAGFGGWTYTPVTFSATAVPEPGSVALLLAGLGALGVAGRRRARA